MYWSIKYDILCFALILIQLLSPGVVSLETLARMGIYCDNSCDVYRSDKIAGGWYDKTKIGSSSDWSKPLLLPLTGVTAATSIYVTAKDSGGPGGIMACINTNGGVDKYCTEPSSIRYCNNWRPYAKQPDGSYKLAMPADIVFTRYGDGAWGRQMEYTPAIPDPAAEWLWNSDSENEMLFWFRFGVIADDQALVIVQCDNVATIYYNNFDSKGWITSKSGTNWKVPIKAIIPGVNIRTKIKVECQDNGYVGGFIGNVYYLGKHYYTKNPITSSKWKVIAASSGGTTSLVYNKKDSGAWGNNVDDVINDDAYWVWNEETNNKIAFGISISDLD